MILGVITIEGGIGEDARLVDAPQVPYSLVACGPSGSIISVCWRLGRMARVPPVGRDVQVLGQFRYTDPGQKFIRACIPLVDFVSQFVCLVVEEAKVVA